MMIDTQLIEAVRGQGHHRCSRAQEVLGLKIT